MAAGFTLEGFETPEQIKERIGKTKESDIKKSLTGNIGDVLGQRAYRQGAGILGGLRNLLGGQDVEPPEIQMARTRQEIMQTIDLNDPLQVAQAGKAALDKEDISFGTWLYDRANKLQQQKSLLDIEKGKLEAAKDKAGKPKEWKWKHWQPGIRNNFASTTRELDWVKDINNEEQEERVADAINARAEDLWNTYREQGANISQQQAYGLAAQTASRHFKAGILDDTFDFEGFSTDMATSFNLGSGSYGETEKPKAKGSKKPIRKAGAYPRPVASDIKLLRSNPTKQAISQYNEIYGPGAAEKVLPKAGKKVKVPAVEEEFYSGGA